MTASFCKWLTMCVPRPLLSASNLMFNDKPAVIITGYKHTSLAWIAPVDSISPTQLKSSLLHDVLKEMHAYILLVRDWELQSMK